VGPARVLVRSPQAGATAASLAAAALALAVEVLVPGGWGELSWAVLVAGLVVGLPHGAVDHVLLGARLGRSVRRRVALTGGYAVLAVLAYLLFRAFPAPGLAAFVILSLWHFGSGETAVADLRSGPVRRRVPAALVFGSVVLLVPLARPSAEAAAVVAAILPGHPDGRALLPSAVVPAVVVAAALLGAALLVRGRRLEALELAVLLAVALVLPPPVALGVYFGAWHSVRHVGRLLAEDPLRGSRRPLRTLARAAALPTAAALGALLLLRAAVDDGDGFVVALLPVLAALTVPHTVVVTWLDRAQDQAGSRRIGTCGMPSST
jgi:Brp/Blh family beta-carotene 15,15'-monooxygenase